jgi:hypothetical protein
MSRLSDLIGNCKSVVVRVLLDMAIGITFGVAFWTFYYISQGNLAHAIQGNVEDAISTLHGLVYLGGLVGSGIGILHGLAMMAAFQNPKQE